MEPALQKYEPTYCSGKNRLFFLAVFVYGIVFSNVSAVPITSNGTGGGNWNSTSTWSGGTIPSSADTAIIAAGDAVILDVSTSIRRLVFEGGPVANSLTHSGTISLTIEEDVEINGPTANNQAQQWLINAGSATIGNNLILNINGPNNTRTSTVTISAGTLSVDSLVYNSNDGFDDRSRVEITAAGVINMSGNIYLAGNNGSLDCGTQGRFNFTGSIDQILLQTGGGNIIFHDVYIQGGNSRTVFIDANVDQSNEAVTGGIYVENGTLDAQTFTVSLPGQTFSVSDGATFATQESGAAAFPAAGSYSLSSASTVIYNGAVNQTISARTYGNLTVTNTNPTANHTWTLVGNTTVNGDLSVSSAGTGLTILNMTTLPLNGTASGTFSMGDNTILYLSGANNFPASFGTFSFSSGSEVQYEAAAIEQTIAAQSSTTSNTITYAVLDIRNGLGSGVAKVAAGPLTVSGDLQLGTGGNNAIFNMGAYTHTFLADWLDGGSTVMPSTSTAVFSGADQTISSGTFNEIVFSGNGTKSVTTSLTGQNISVENGVTVNISGALTTQTSFDAGSSAIAISGAFINNGNFDAGSSSISVTGNWTDNGTFAAGTSTVTFGGGDSNILSNEVFYDLILNSTGADRALDFGTAASPVKVTVNNNFDITAGEVRIFDLPGSELSVAGNLTIANTTAAGIEFAGSDIVIETGGNFLNNNTLGGPNDGLTSLDGTEEFTFNGSGTHIFRPNTASLGNITMTKSSGQISLDGALSISNTLTLTGGLIVTSAANLLTLASTAVIVGGSSASYIEGPLVHTLNTSGTRTYPIGKAAAYRPMELNLSSVAGSPQVQAEVFDGPSGGSADTDILQSISSARYYQTAVVNTGTISAGTVKLSIGSDDGVSDLSTTVVARSGSQTGTYSSIGRSATSGTATNGTITSDTYDFVEAGDYFLLGFEETNPVKLAILDISPNPIVLNESFSVTVQAQNASGSPANVSGNTGVSLTRAITGSGSLGSTTTGTILANENQVVISGVTYATAEDIQIIADRTSGDDLDSDTSAVISVASAFYSASSGDPATLTNWNSARDGTGSTPGTISGLFIVQNGHTMTTTAAFSESDTDLRVEGGGQFINNVGTMQIGDLIIENSGLVRANSEIQVASTSVLNIKNGGEFINNNNARFDQAGSLFAGTENFEAGSIFTALDMRTGNAASMDIFAAAAYGNLTLNLTGNTNNFSFSGNLAEVANTLTIQSTGTGRVELGDAAADDYTLNIGGDFIVSGGTIFLVDADIIATLNVAGNLQVSSGELRMTDAAGDPQLNVSGNVTISGGTLNLSAMNTGNSTLAVAGNLTHTAGTISETANGSGTVVFNGSLAQTWTAGGTLTGDNLNFTLDNSSGVTLAGAGVTITGTLTLTSGNLNTSTTGNIYITIGSTGTVAGGSSSSFVNGRMAQIWGLITETKTYPIGSAGTYRPLELTLATPSSPVIRAQVYKQNPGGTPQYPLINISGVRYYQTSILSGSVGNATVKLTWGSDDGVANIDSIVVAHSTSSGGMYISIGKSATSGDASSGSVTSESYAPNSPDDFLALGATSADISLPVQLTAFSAKALESSVRLAWRTESEINNAGWIIERAVTPDTNITGNNLAYLQIAMLDGRGTTADAFDYEFVDTDVKGGVTYLYRIADMTYDGAVTYHDALRVFFAAPQVFQLYKNYPNPFNPSTTLKFSLPVAAEVKIKIFNVLGQETVSLLEEAKEPGFHRVIWDGKNAYGESVAAGVYFVSMQAISQSQGLSFNQVVKIVLLR